MKLSPTESVLEQPVFGLGMSGFGPVERKLLESSLGPRSARPGWRSCTFQEADAWWINGANVRLMPDGNLRVAAGLPSEKALRLDLPEIDRPIAFAAPLAPADFEPHWQFQPLSPASIEAVLLHFDAWLWRQRAQFVLGARIVEAIEQLRGGVYHVSLEGRLLAIVDFEQDRAAFLPRTHPESLWPARWDRRPISAHDQPESFVSTTLADLAFTYVHHTERDMLPARYRQRCIYFRRMPRVPLRRLRESQLRILCELSAHAATLDELGRRTGLARARLERDVACLYYANAITTQQHRAAPAGHGFQAAAIAPRRSELDGDALWDQSANQPTAGPAASMMPTAPVMLDVDGGASAPQAVR